MTDHDGHRSDPGEPTDDEPTDSELTGDEIVAAVLDGEATPAERARVEDDPRLLERLAQFRAVAEQVGRPVVAEPDRHEAAVAAALAEITTGPGPLPGSAVAEPVTLLRRRERPVRALAPWLAAAAALLVLVPLGWALTRDDGVPDQTTAMTAEGDRGAGTGRDGPAGGPAADEADRSAADGRQSGPTTGLPLLDAQSDPAAGEIADLGPIDSLDQLRALLGPGFTDDAAVYTEPGASPERAEAPTSSDAGPTRCEAALRRGDPSLGSLVLAGTATYQGSAVFVYVFAEAGTAPGDDDDPAPHVVVVAANPGCTVVERASR